MIPKRGSEVLITPPSARTGALITVAGAMGPTIFGDPLRISEPGTSKWYGRAAGDWGRYAVHAAWGSDQQPGRS